MHTDKPMYLLLSADPEFLRLLTDGINITGPYHLEALDVKALERRIDGVILPEDDQQPIWAIEIQAQRDPLIYHRLFIDMGLLGERHPKRDIRGLLLFISPAQDPKTRPWQPCLEQASAHCPVRRVYLLDVLNRLKHTDPAHPLLATFLPYLLEDREHLREQAPQAYRQIQQAALSARARRHCLDVFQSWLMARFDQLTLEEILIMLGELTPLEQTRAYRDIVEKNQPIWLDQGRREGRQEGRQEGLREGEAQLLLRQLQCRFGALSEAQQRQIKALQVEQLEALGEALLEFKTRAEVDAWLNAHPA